MDKNLGKSIPAPTMKNFQIDNYYPINVGDLPANWEVANLGDWTNDIRSGQANGHHNSQNIGIPHLRPMNIDRHGRIVLSNVKYVSPQTSLRLMPGDVLFNNTNSPELVGKTSFIASDTDWTFSNHMTRIRLPENLSPSFVAHQLHFLWMTGYFRYRCTQHVNQASISSHTLADSVPLVVAPPSEQKRIVAEIEKHLARLEVAEQLLGAIRMKLDNYCLLILKKACEGTLVPNELTLTPTEGYTYESGQELLQRIINDNNPAKSKLIDKAEKIVLPGIESGAVQQDQEHQVHSEGYFPLPAGWVWARVCQVGEVIGGRQRSPKDHTGQNMRQYLRVANVYENRIDTSDLLKMNFTPEEFKTYKLEMNDILLNEGQSPELVGRPAIFRNEVVDACFQNTLIRFRVYSGLSPMFALIVFRHYLHTKRFQDIARWSTNIAHLGSTRFAQMKFPLPSLAEQERIVTEVDRCLSLADKQSAIVSSVLERINWLRQTIMKKAFTGTLVPQYKEEGSASDLYLNIQSQRHKQKSKVVPNKERLSAVKKTSPIRRRPLHDVLLEAGTSMSPQDMLRESGIAESSIGDFYIELKSEIKAGRITQNPSTDEKTYILASNNHAS